MDDEASETHIMTWKISPKIKIAISSGSCVGVCVSVCLCVSVCDLVCLIQDATLHICLCFLQYVSVYNIERLGWSRA